MPDGPVVSVHLEQSIHFVDYETALVSFGGVDEESSFQTVEIQEHVAYTVTSVRPPAGEPVEVSCPCIRGDPDIAGLIGHAVAGNIRPGRRDGEVRDYYGPRQCL